MSRSLRPARIAAVTGVAALALVSTVSTAGSVTASASTAHPGTAGSTALAAVRQSGGMVPAAGAKPPRIKAGTITPGLRPHTASATVFNCQSAAAPLVCYGPQQIRHAYGIDALIGKGYAGKHKTIVIVDAYQSPTLRQDLAEFNTAFGLPSAPLQVVAPQGLTPFDPTDSNQVGWAGEISLDVQWAHAIAPEAKIVLALAKSNNDNDILATTAYVVRHRLGDVISQSFGEAESCFGVNADGTRLPGTTLAAQHRIFAKAAQKRMTVFAAAGDHGSAEPTCDGSGYKLAASSPASDPLVTSVGGTQLFADPVTGAYDHEVVWNEESTFGSGTVGGGGFSTVYPQPAWQRSAGDLPGRGVPDVAYDAAINGGVLVAFSVTAPLGSFYIFGGTSSGSPQWAGLAADTAQLNKHALGDINPALYRIASRAPADFHDITVGSNQADGVFGFTAGPGWDAASGLGSPVADPLAHALATAR